MSRWRRASGLPVLIMLCGLVITMWAASGAASVAGAGPRVVVTLDADDILELSCKEGVGHKDGFCKSEAGERLRLNFNAGRDDRDFGLQPGSRYVFGKVMLLRNNWTAPVDVKLRVAAVSGELARVLSVHAELDDGRQQIFPPDHAATITMRPGEEIGFSFAFGVPADWGTFADAETRYPLAGEVIVFIERDDDGDGKDNDNGGGDGGGNPGGNGSNTPDDDDPPSNEPEAADDEQRGETLRTMTGNEPAAGGGNDDPAEIDASEGDPVPEASLLRAGPGNLPFTGGGAWGYTLIGLLLTGTGAGIFVWQRVRAF